MLSVQNLAKSYGGRILFEGVSFGIEEGDRIGLVGPNGAGKSTLLKMLAREITPDAGQVTYRRGVRVGYLSQAPLFNANRTILEVLLENSKEPELDLAQAYEWMAKLNFNQFGENFQVSQLSGGWQKRLALGRELMKNPDLLLLDEPTNHLDVHQILWLEEFLTQASFSILMITHDRLFLQRVVNQILDLDTRNPNYLIISKGDYIHYVELKDSLLQSQFEREKVLKNIYRKELSWLRRGAQARQTKQKARIERAQDLKNEVVDLHDRNRNTKADIHFGDLGRAPQKLIEIQDLKIQFGEQVLFEGLNYKITPQTRLALLGDNGAGKTSLIRAVMGEIQPAKGTVQIGDGVQVAYFEQKRQTLDPQKSLFRNLISEGDYVDCRGEFIYAKSYLERFLFKPQQMDLPVAQLSGGEQSRLRLAQLMLKKVQVLILDEPTNDLDVETLSVLEQALKDFQGAVILVTHDRYFMDQVATDILSFTSEYQDNKVGAISRLDFFKGYLQWEKWDQENQKNKEQASKSTMISKSNMTSRSPAAANSTTLVPAKSQRLSYKERYELEHMEENILKLESELDAHKKEIEDPSVVSKSQRVYELSVKMNDLQTRLDQMYQRWTDLEKKAP